LSFNRIQRVILKNGFDISGPRFKLNLEGNPLICDCAITELKQKLEGNLDRNNLYVDMFTLTSHNLVCGPNSFGKNSGKYLQNVKFDDLLCPFPSASMPYDCTEQCSCFLERFHKETIMNCSNQNLTAFPQNLVLLEGESNTIQLHMENNFLTNIFQEITKPLFNNISHLYLSNNRIVHLNKETIPDNLAVLYVDNNRIEKIEEEDLEYLDSLVKKTDLQLKLSRNPFKCSCDNRNLYHFVQNRKEIIEDASIVSLQCEESDMELLGSDLHDFCNTSLSPVLIAIVIIIVIVLMVVCIVLILYSCHRETIKIWIYSKSWARIFFTEDLIDKDKPYDAFISYSHVDADFVEKELLQGLENPGPGEQKYSCLIHTRDWSIGQMIPDQILQSVESSRRSIIVLSKAYIESMWTQLEFRAAHTQAIQDKTQRVILITVGQLPPREQLDSHLQKYLSLNTYLDTQDPWFWQKLRYAMPHKGTMWKKTKSRRVSDKIELIRSMVGNWKIME
jgi:protein toll